MQSGWVMAAIPPLPLSVNQADVPENVPFLWAQSQNRGPQKYYQGSAPGRRETPLQPAIRHARISQLRRL
jgi:hypothetical protein